MSVYLLLNLAVIGILTGAALLIVAIGYFIRADQQLTQAREEVALAEAKRVAAQRALFESLHAFWAALNTVRKTGARS